MIELAYEIINLCTVFQVRPKFEAKSPEAFLLSLLHGRHKINKTENTVQSPGCANRNGKHFLLTNAKEYYEMLVNAKLPSEELYGTL